MAGGAVLERWGQPRGTLQNAAGANTATNVAAACSDMSITPLFQWIQGDSRGGDAAAAGVGAADVVVCLFLLLLLLLLLVLLLLLLLLRFVCLYVCCWLCCFVF